MNTERAIVTDIAGTTRDVIKETLDMDVAVTLIDTAGIRDSEEVGKVEEIGIEYSKQSADEADLVIFLYDSVNGMTDEDIEIYSLIKTKPTSKPQTNATFLKPAAAEIFIFLPAPEKELPNFAKNQNNGLRISIEDTEYITNERQADCLKNAAKVWKRLLRPQRFLNYKT